MKAEEGTIWGTRGGKKMSEEEYFAMRKRAHPQTLRLQQQNRATNWRVVLGLVVGMGFMCALPLALHNRRTTPHWQQDAPLRAHEIRRGPYNNTGSKDVGRDPDYDWERRERRSSTRPVRSTPQPEQPPSSGEADA